MSDETIVWISGATQGVGAALVDTCPYDDARIINVSRSARAGADNVRFDLSDPSTWEAVRQSFRRELNGFRGRRAIFIHNAFVGGTTGFASEVDEHDYFGEVMGNCAAPLVLADWFLREVGEEYESGLVLMSSAAARISIEGNSVYCAAKAAAEQWVRTVRLELARRGRRTWVVAVRPGFIDTPGLRWGATLDVDRYPIAHVVREALARGEATDAHDAARVIWDALTPEAPKAVLTFGQPPEGV